MYSLLAVLTAHAEVDTPVPMRKTVPALQGPANTTMELTDVTYCSSKARCQFGDATCCPLWDNSDFEFACAPDFAATCFFLDGTTYCPHDHPVVCHGFCCRATEECVTGHCRPIGTKEQRESPYEFGVHHANLQWLPTRNTAFDLKFEVGLHDMIFPHVAKQMRDEMLAPIQQCWVIGFPEDLHNCVLPTDSGCRGTHTAFSLVEPVEITAQPVDSEPILEQSITWCNDDPSKTQEESFQYSESYSSEWFVSVTTSVSVEVGVTSETSFNIEVVSEKATISVKAKVDVASTSAQRTITKKQYSSSQKVLIGPRSRVISRCWINKAKLRAPWKARVTLAGNVVWACGTSYHPHEYYYKTDKWNFWTIESLRKSMKEMFNLSDQQLDEIWTKEIHGTFNGIHGFDVQCSTHTEILKEGEMCKVDNSTQTAPLEIVY